MHVHPLNGTLWSQAESPHTYPHRPPRFSSTLLSLLPPPGLVLAEHCVILALARLPSSCLRTFADAAVPLLLRALPAPTH
jgi:hypothetical protein